MTCTSANTVSCGNKLVTVFAAPYLDSLPNTDKFQSSNNLHHRNAIPKPAAPYLANNAPYQLATGTVSEGGLKVTFKIRWFFIGLIVFFLLISPAYHDNLHLT